jgi:hypothetical protein
MGRLTAGIAAAALMLTGTAQAAPAAEHLVMKPYPGAAWKVITNQTSHSAWNHEQIPGGETEANFTEILTDQGFPDLAGADPVLFLKQRFQQVMLSCDSVRVNGPTLRLEGGVRVAYGQLYCGQQRGQDYGVHVFFKIISGEAAAYAVSLDVHTPASTTGGVLSFPAGHEDEMRALLKTESAANAYIESGVYLCGGRSTDPRCGK